MKSNIHPQVSPNATVTCVCGNRFTTGSTLDDMRTEICSRCHPFYTGKQKLVDTAGRVEKFQKRAEAAKVKAKVHASKKQKLAKKEAIRVAKKVEK